jgi:hypothetical protein
VRFVGDLGAGPCDHPYSNECQSLIMAKDVAPRTGIAKSVLDTNLGMGVSYLINTTLLERCLPGDNFAGTSKASSVWRQPKVRPFDARSIPVLFTCYCLCACMWWGPGLLLAYGHDGFVALLPGWIR